MLRDRVDFELLVPSYLLGNERFRQFVEMLEENISDVMFNVDELLGLLALWWDVEVNEWLEGYCRNFGVDWFLSELEKVRAFLPVFIDFVREKGSYSFLVKMMGQVGNEIFITNLSDQCLRWSSNKRWDYSVFEDRVYYREKSLLVEGFGLDIEWLRRVVPLGVFVWVVVYFWLYFMKKVLRTEFDIGFDVIAREDLDILFSKNVVSCHDFEERVSKRIWMYLSSGFDRFGKVVREKIRESVSYVVPVEVSQKSDSLFGFRSDNCLVAGEKKISMMCNWVEVRFVVNENVVVLGG